MSTNQNNDNSDLGFWIVTIVLFCVGLWPISVFLLIRKFFFSGNRKAAARHPYDIQREQACSAKAAQTTDSAADRIWNAAEQAVNKAEAEFRRQSAGSSGTRRTSERVQAAPAGKGKSARSGAKAGKSRPPRGNALIVWGAILSGIFALSTMSTSLTFLQSFWYGSFLVDELMAVLTCALFLAGGLVMLGSGLNRKRRGKRWLKYLNLIGTRKTVSISALANVSGTSRRRVLDDLQDMLDKGFLPAGYLDLSRDLLVLSADGIPDEEPVSAPEPEPQDDNAVLAQIRAVNNAIPDPVMSGKIDRIEEITGRILDYQRSHPEKSGQLRGFLNYYLPTTLKILNSYAQLDAQGVEGENITAAKQRIEGMMDKVVEGFENQLDKLFADSAMDISSDVAVLEQMLEKDGLSGGQGMTLGG